MDVEFTTRSTEEIRIEMKARFDAANVQAELDRQKSAAARAGKQTVYDQRWTRQSVATADTAEPDENNSSVG